MQTKKGFILVYTILVGIICTIIMMYIFDIQMAEVKYSTSNRKYILKEDLYQKHKEYLTTLFFTYINENNEIIKKVGIINFFYNSKTIVKYEKAKVSYSNINNEFIFSIPYENEIYRNDYFKLVDIGEVFKIIFIKTEYYKNM